MQGAWCVFRRKLKAPNLGALLRFTLFIGMAFPSTIDLPCGRNSKHTPATSASLFQIRLFAVPTTGRWSVCSKGAEMSAKSVHPRKPVNVQPSPCIFPKKADLLFLMTTSTFLIGTVRLFCIIKKLILQNHLQPIYRYRYIPY